MRRAVSQWMLAATALVVAVAAGANDVWTVIAVDPKGDARNAALADAAQLSYRYDTQQDMLWLRVTLYGKADAQTLAVDIAIDTGAGGAAEGPWRGANKEFKFDKLITAREGRGGGYHVTIGGRDAEGAKVNIAGDSILIGLKRTDLAGAMKMNLIAAVGSDQVWNDDIPNLRSATLDLSASRPTRGLREIDLDRNNFRFAAGYKTVSDNEPAQIVKRGRGQIPLILVPGVYSGGEVFDGFIARNESTYRFYVVTPPGLNRTAARPLPPETTSYGDFTWTRRLARDIADLVNRERLNKPVIVAHGFPGTLAAEELATAHPGTLGGVVEVASMPVQFAPSMRDPSRMATPDERIAVVNDAWAQKWFKYVTPETWESNNYPAEMFANDPERAERARRQVEAAPLPVKIRYLSEFMASDHSAELTNIGVPLLALRPGFNDRLLADPAYGWFKASFQNSWEPFSRNSRIQLTTIPDARALMLDDQPTLADRAIATFVEATRTAKDR